MIGFRSSKISNVNSFHLKTKQEKSKWCFLNTYPQRYLWSQFPYFALIYYFPAYLTKRNIVFVLFLIFSFSINIHHTVLLVYTLSLSLHLQSCFFFTLCSAKQDKGLRLKRNVSFLESTHFCFFIQKIDSNYKVSQIYFCQIIYQNVTGHARLKNCENEFNIFANII